MQGSLEISDPWDFPQIGRIPLVVLATGSDETLVRFETRVACQGRIFAGARLSPRYDGGRLARATEAPLPVDIALMPDPVGGRDEAEDSQQVFVVGTFRLNDAATSQQQPQIS